MSDRRPICTCNAYRFPHKIGGKCTGSAYAEYYYNFEQTCCDSCSCNHDNQCDVVNGAESIKHADCYQEHLLHGGRYLPLEPEYPEEETHHG